jgi:cell division protein FtsB
MESFVITWRELLVVVVLVLAVYIAEMLLLMRSGGNRGLRLWKKGALASAQNREVEELRVEVRELRERISRLEGDMGKQQSVIEAATPYNQAIQLAKQGVDASDLAASCGISRGEAELIIALYRSQKA